MEKKKWVKLAGFAMVFLLSLFLCVGCAENSAEDSDEVAYVDLSQGFSRGIESVNETQIPIDSLYWTYKATKVRGNYTTGQTQTEKAVVKNGPATGLGTVGPFSVGVWHFEIFGYRSCTENASGELEFTDLIYKCCDRLHQDPSVDESQKQRFVEATIDKRPDGATAPLEVIFELENMSDEVYGTLAFSDVAGSFTLTVPEGQKIFGTKHPLNADGTDFKAGAEIVVKVWAEKDATDVTPAAAVAPATVGSNLIATSKTLVTTDKKPGEVITLNAFGFVLDGDVPRNKFKGANTQDSFSGIHNLYFAVEYMDKYTYMRKDSEYKWSTKTDGTQNIYDDGYAPVGEITVYPLAFMANIKTTISGDVNDIKVGEGSVNGADMKTAVAKIYWAAGGADNPDYIPTGSEEAPAYSLYPSLERALYAYETNFSTKGDNTKPYIELLQDIESATLTGTKPDGTADVALSGTEFPILAKTLFVDSLTVKSGKTVKLYTVYDTASPVVVSVKATGADKVVKDFHSNTTTKEIWFVTVGGDVTAEVPTYTVYHTGKADKVDIIECANDKTSNRGYFLEADVDDGDPATLTDVVTINKGYLNLEDKIKVAKLVADVADKTDVVLSGSKDTKVTSYAYKTTELKATANSYVSPLTTALENGQTAFKQITLNANGATAANTTQYVYGIEGVELELPKFATLGFSATLPKAIMNWNCRYDGNLPVGLTFTDGGKFVAGSKDTTMSGTPTEIEELKAVVADTLGGRLFYFGNPADDNSGTAADEGAVAVTYSQFRFYGEQVGSDNEMTGWETLTAAEQIKSLKGAVYYIKASSGTIPAGYIAFSKADTSGQVTGEVDVWATGTPAVPTKSVWKAPTETLGITAYTYNDWRTGSIGEYERLRKVVENDRTNSLFSAYEFWTNVEDTTDPAVTTKGYYYSLDTRDFTKSAPKTESKYVIPVRTI